MSVNVREVFDFELNQYKTHLKALDTDSRYKRFCCAMSDEAIDLFVDKLDPSSTKLFCIEDAELFWVGVGHIAYGSETAELAFSVIPNHQQKGLGAALFTRCINWCRVRGIRHGELVCLPNNVAMQKLCKRNGVEMTGSVERQGVVSLPTPSLTTLAEEFFHRGIDSISWFSKRPLWHVK